MPDGRPAIKTATYEGEDRRALPVGMGNWALANSHILGYVIAGVVFGVIYLLGSSTISSTSEFAHAIQESRIATSASLCAEINRKVVEPVLDAFPQTRSVLTGLDCARLVSGVRLDR